jgi:hypothetical protein
VLLAAHVAKRMRCAARQEEAVAAQAALALQVADTILWGGVTKVILP